MPARMTMRWPNGGSAASATSGGSTRRTSQNGANRMSGAPADRLAEQALRPERQHREHADIKSGRRPGVAEPRGVEGLEEADSQRAQQRVGHAAPAAQCHG